MQKQMRLTNKFIFRDAQLKLLRTEGGQARNQRDGWMGEVGLSGSNCRTGIPPTTHRWVGPARLLSGRMLSHLFCSFLVTQKICTEPRQFANSTVDLTGQWMIGHNAELTRVDGKGKLSTVPLSVELIGASVSVDR